MPCLGELTTRTSCLGRAIQLMFQPLLGHEESLGMQQPHENVTPLHRRNMLKAHHRCAGEKEMVVSSHTPHYHAASLGGSPRFCH